MIGIKKYQITKPAADQPFVETKVELPLACTPVKFVLGAESVDMYVMMDDTQRAFEERFILVRSDVSLVEIFGSDPWNYRETLVDNGEAYHVFVHMTTAERMRIEQQRIQLMQQMEMMKNPAGGGGGKGGDGLILPGR